MWHVTCDMWHRSQLLAVTGFVGVHRNAPSSTIKHQLHISDKIDGGLQRPALSPKEATRYLSTALRTSSLVRSERLRAMPNKELSRSRSFSILFAWGGFNALRVLETTKKGSPGPWNGWEKRSKQMFKTGESYKLERPLGGLIPCGKWECLAVNNCETYFIRSTGSKYCYIHVYKCPMEWSLEHVDPLVHRPAFLCAHFIFQRIRANNSPTSWINYGIFIRHWH